jgi:hypothetical protein
MELKIKESAHYLNNVVNFRKSIFDEISSKRFEPVWLKASLKDVKNVVVINSASRSGSSLLFATLKKNPNFYSLSGEDVPFFKLNGLSGDAFPSDEISKEFKDANSCAVGISRDFLSDFSIASNHNAIFKDNNLLDRYIDDLALRLPLQWPQICFSFDVFRRLAKKAFNNYRKTSCRFCKEGFYLELIWVLRKEYKTINPYYYDIPASMVADKFPSLKVPAAPPNSVLTIEEPPFILLSPDRRIERRDLAHKTLLLKSSTNCYRMNFIKSLLPNADIKIVYLTRNPAGAINGLYDGWLYRGFFSHNLKTFFNKDKRALGVKMLGISGYSDKHTWGKWWWNYDLPSSWQDYAQSRLEEVCGFQWYSANRAIQEYLNQRENQHCRVSYENIIKSLDSRKKEIVKIMNFIGMGSSVIKQLELDKLPIVQATEIPQLYRWKKRANILLPIINSPKISEMSVRMGYNKKDIGEWF